jgi:hypothetical protein
LGETWAEYAVDTNPIKGLYKTVSVVGGDIDIGGCFRGRSEEE